MQPLSVRGASKSDALDATHISEPIAAAAPQSGRCWPPTARSSTRPEQGADEPGTALAAIEEKPLTFSFEDQAPFAFSFWQITDLESRLQTPGHRFFFFLAPHRTPNPGYRRRPQALPKKYRNTNSAE